MKVGDKLYKWGEETHMHNVIYILSFTIEKVTPKRYKMSNGEWVNKDTLQVVGKYDCLCKYEDLPERIITLAKLQSDFFKLRGIVRMMFDKRFNGIDMGDIDNIKHINKMLSDIKDILK